MGYRQPQLVGFRIEKYLGIKFLHQIFEQPLSEISNYWKEQKANLGRVEKWFCSNPNIKNTATYFFKRIFNAVRFPAYLPDAAEGSIT